MLYELIKKEKIEELRLYPVKDQNNLPYNPFCNDDKFYYDLVEDIHEFSKTSGADYVITGLIALALFFGKTYRPTKDLDMHINIEDLEKWIHFFENRFGKINIVDRNNDVGKLMQGTQIQKYSNYKIQFTAGGKEREIELFATISARFARKNDSFDVDNVKNINVSIKNNIKVKMASLRLKDIQDLYYYNLINYAFIIYKHISFSLTIIFYILRHIRFWLLFVPIKYPRLKTPIIHKYFDV